MTFDEFMEEVAADAGGAHLGSAPISHEGQLARARELAERVAAGNPFKVGDVVTPRPDAPVKFAGTPHAVVEKRLPVPFWDFAAGQAGSTAFGGAYDLRVAHVYDDHTVLHWVESVYFEHYQPLGHDPLMRAGGDAS